MEKIKRELISFKLTTEMKEKLEILAQSLDVTKATAIRYSIDQAIKTNLPK